MGIYRPSLILVVILGLATTTTALLNGVTTSPAAQNEGMQHENLFLLHNVEIYDGDTLTADIHLGLDIVVKDRTIRLKDFDAPEITRIRRTVEISDKEIEQGKEARGLVVALAKTTVFAIGESLTEKGNKDPYGRLVANTYFIDKPTMKWKSLATFLKEKGFDRNASAAEGNSTKRKTG